MSDDRTGGGADAEWRTDGHGSWYCARKLRTTGGLGVPGDLYECNCGRPTASPHAHRRGCPVISGWEEELELP